MNSIKILKQSRLFAKAISVQPHDFPINISPEVDFPTINKKIRNHDFTIKAIPLNKVVFTQETVRNEVLEYLENNSNNHELPIVVEFDDRYYVWDGHHRITLARKHNKLDTLANVISI